MKKYFLLVLLLTYQVLIAQDANQINLVEVNVVGNTITSKNTIIFTSGLREGTVVNPTDFPRAIKRLWQLGIFQDIQLQYENETNDGLSITIKVKENYPEISRKMRIGVKHKNQKVDDKKRKTIAKNLQEITLGRVKVKNHWMTNRMGVGDGVWMEGAEFNIDEKNFVKGCAMVFGKIFRKMEILVDGTAVLCCEDATKRTDYGNVFKDGVEKVWGNLREEILLIYSKKYTEAKNNLICYIKRK